MSTTLFASPAEAHAYELLQATAEYLKYRGFVVNWTGLTASGHCARGLQVYLGNRGLSAAEVETALDYTVPRACLRYDDHRPGAIYIDLRPLLD